MDGNFGNHQSRQRKQKSCVRFDVVQERYLQPEPCVMILITERIRSGSQESKRHDQDPPLQEFQRRAGKMRLPVKLIQRAAQD